MPRPGLTAGALGPSMLNSVVKTFLNILLNILLCAFFQVVLVAHVHVHGVYPAPYFPKCVGRGSGAITMTFFPIFPYVDGFHDVQ